MIELTWRLKAINALCENSTNKVLTMAALDFDNVMMSAATSAEANRTHYSATVTQAGQGGLLKFGNVETATTTRGSEILLENPNGNTSGSSTDDIVRAQLALAMLPGAKA